MRLAKLTALLLALCTGAAAAAEEVGSGELWLHESVMEYYREFERDHGRHYFAVSTNGLSAGYSYCKGFNCAPLQGKREALRACGRNTSDLPGTCYIFANRSGILWRGTVHVLDDAQFAARLYGPETVEAALEGYVEQIAGPAAGVPQAFTPTPAVWQRDDFRFAPADLAPGGDECRYAFEDLYMPSVARNFFLLSPDGRRCAFSTGFPADSERVAFGRALAACDALAGAPCLVYAAGAQVLAGRSRP